jgi:hypothetical protein
MVGYDVGFDKASDDWFAKYASAWVAFHLPKFGKEVKAKAKKK